MFVEPIQEKPLFRVLSTLALFAGMNVLVRSDVLGSAKQQRVPYAMEGRAFGFSLLPPQNFCRPDKIVLQFCRLDKFTMSNNILRTGSHENTAAIAQNEQASTDACEAVRVAPVTPDRQALRTPNIPPQIHRRAQRTPDRTQTMIGRRLTDMMGYDRRFEASEAQEQVASPTPRSGSQASSLMSPLHLPPLRTLGGRSQHPGLADRLFMARLETSQAREPQDQAEPSEPQQAILGLGITLETSSNPAAELPQTGLLAGRQQGQETFNRLREYMEAQLQDEDRLEADTFGQFLEWVDASPNAQMFVTPVQQPGMFGNPLETPLRGRDAVADDLHAASWLRVPTTAPTAPAVQFQPAHNAAQDVLGSPLRTHDASAQQGQSPWLHVPEASPAVPFQAVAARAAAPEASLGSAIVFSFERATRQPDVAAPGADDEDAAVSSTHSEAQVGDVATHHRRTSTAGSDSPDYKRHCP